MTVSDVSKLHTGGSPSNSRSTNPGTPTLENSRLGAKFISYQYRIFRSRFSDLGRLHWAFSYSAELSDMLLQKSIAEGKDTLLLHEVHPSKGITDEHLHISVAQYAREKPEMLGRLRLLLLVEGCAILEEYLHSFAPYCMIFLGHTEKPDSININNVGKALLKPAQASTLSVCTEIIATLMSFKPDAERTKQIANAYQIRCSAAHNGGIVDEELKKKCDLFAAAALNSRIQIPWNELQQYLVAFFDFATTLEHSIPPHRLGAIEFLCLASKVLAQQRGRIGKAAKLRPRKKRVAEERTLATEIRNTTIAHYHYGKYVPSHAAVLALVQAQTQKSAEK